VSANQNRRSEAVHRFDLGRQNGPVPGSNPSSGTAALKAVTVGRFGLRPGQPACLADLLLGHWAIEARHHLRDVTFCEDASQVRTGAGPHVMACLRNLVIRVLCRGRSTSPPHCAATAATNADPSPPSGSDSSAIVRIGILVVVPPGGCAGHRVFLPAVTRNAVGPGAARPSGSPYPDPRITAGRVIPEEAWPG
jgi:hypothetical protein